MAARFASRLPVFRSLAKSTNRSFCPIISTSRPFWASLKAKKENQRQYMTTLHKGGKTTTDISLILQQRSNSILYFLLFYCPNYFSIEDIVLQDVRVSCKFEVSVPKLGMLDQSADDQDLKQGSKVELPFWMVPTLHAKKVITFEIPRHYKVNYRQILQADSIVVDLHKWGPYFYDLGLHVANLELSDSIDIKKSLVQTLLNRLRHIMDMSQHSTHHETVHLISNLDELERKLFGVGQLSFKSYKEWVRRESSKINTAALVASHRKRKFAEVTV